MLSEVAEAEPSGKRERAKAANRQAILVAARRVFAQLGYDAATVRDVIRGTELASGTFYNYFRSKEEVFEALADDAARRFRPILREAREQHAASFEDYLRAAFVAYFHFMAEENAAEGRPIDERRPHVRSDTPEIMAVYEEVRLGIEDAIDRGLAPRLDADYLACACIGIAQEVGTAMLRRAPADVHGAARFAAGLILNGLAGASSKS
ncbi:transcriptional regulator of TetR family [alpha proteobacterium U9-1i]|nr:transcriptional regulator of TetR family [alpha proteobacterium U9-1i]